jgi:hypothetical protein
MTIFFSNTISIETRTREIVKKGLNVNPHEGACKRELIRNPIGKFARKN